MILTFFVTFHCCEGSNRTQWRSTGFHVQSLHRNIFFGYLSNGPSLYPFVAHCSDYFSFYKQPAGRNSLSSLPRVRPERTQLRSTSCHAQSFYRISFFGNLPKRPSLYRFVAHCSDHLSFYKQPAGRTSPAKVACMCSNRTQSRSTSCHAQSLYRRPCFGSLPNGPSLYRFVAHCSDHFSFCKQPAGRTSPATSHD